VVRNRHGKQIVPNPTENDICFANTHKHLSEDTAELIFVGNLSDEHGGVVCQSGEGHGDGAFKRGWLRMLNLLNHHVLQLLG
jgi:stress response protein SCP2